MDKSLKVIENMIELVYAEIKNATNDPKINDESFRLLKEAIIQTINLKRKVETARGWILTSNQGE